MKIVNKFSLEGADNLSQDKLIQYRKLMSKLYKEIQEKNKSGKCLLCDEEVAGFCNSHSLPRFVLEKISENGIVETSTSPLELNFLPDKKGVKIAGTFHNICRKCDGVFFQKYEAPNNLSQVGLNAEVINLIALKCLLSQLYKKKTASEFGKFFPMMNMTSASQFDISEISNDIKKIKRNLHKNNFTVIVDESLDYVVPIAIQDSFALGVDLKGETINNLYSTSEKYKVISLYLSIFPLGSSSRIIAFYESSSKRYRQFSKQMRQLSLEERLAVINYIAFTYSDSVFLSAEASARIKEDKELCYAIGTLGRNPFDVSEENYKATFSLNEAFKCKNLLSKEFAK